MGRDQKISLDELQQLRLASKKLLDSALKKRALAYNEVVATVRNLLHAEHCSIFTVPRGKEPPFRLWLMDENPRSDSSKCYCTSRNKDKVLKLEIPGKNSLLGQIAYQNEMFNECGKNLCDRPMFDASGLDHLTSKARTSLLVLPLNDRKRNLLGLLKVENKLKLGVSKKFQNARKEAHDKAGFREKDELFARILADELGSILENREFVHVFRELIDYVSVCSTQSPEDIYGYILMQAKRLFRANRGDLVILNKEEGKLFTKAVNDSQHIFPIRAFKGVPSERGNKTNDYDVGSPVPDNSFIGSLWRDAPEEIDNKSLNTKRAKVSRDVSKETDYRPADTRTKSEIAVVLYAAESNLETKKRFGVLNLESFRKGYFDDVDKILLARFAPYAAIVMEWAEKSRKTAQEVRDLYAKLRDVFNNVPLGICRTTLEGVGKYLEFNDELPLIYGYNRAKFLEKNPEDLYRDPHDRKVLLNRIQQSPTGRVGMEFVAKHSDGRERMIFQRVRKKQSSDGGFYLDSSIEDRTREYNLRIKLRNACAIYGIYIHEVLREITTMKVPLTEATVALKDLEALSNHPDRESFLTTIKGLLPIPIEKTAKALTEIKELTALSEEMKRLIIDPDYFRKKKFQDIDMVAFMKQAMADQSDKFECEFTCSVDPRVDSDLGLARISGDPKSLQRVVTNICHNTYKVTNGQGKLNAYVAFSDGRLLVVFEDDGPGYPYHLINKELSSEPLWRGGEGSLGLGIEICTAIVELHGGELRLCSRPDNIRGARTEIALPIISSSGKHPVKIYEQ